MHILNPNGQAIPSGGVTPPEKVGPSERPVDTFTEPTRKVAAIVQSFYHPNFTFKVGDTSHFKDMNGIWVKNEKHDGTVRIQVVMKIYGEEDASKWPGVQMQIKETRCYLNEFLPKEVLQAMFSAMRDLTMANLREIVRGPVDAG